MSHSPCLIGAITRGNSEFQPWVKNDLADIEVVHRARASDFVFENAHSVSKSVEG